MDNSILLKCRVQAALVTAHVAEDNGDFVFVLCRRGLSATLGRKLKIGEELVIKCTLQEISPLVDKQPAIE